MANTTKTIVILENNNNIFNVIYVDADPIISDDHNVDSLTLANWAVEKYATNVASVIDVTFFDSDKAARKWGASYEQFTPAI